MELWPLGLPVELHVMAINVIHDDNHVGGQKMYRVPSNWSPLPWRKDACKTSMKYKLDVSTATIVCIHKCRRCL